MYVCADVCVSKANGKNSLLFPLRIFLNVNANHGRELGGVVEEELSVEMAPSRID